MSEINDYSSFITYISELRNDSRLDLENTKNAFLLLENISNSFESKKALEFLREQVTRFGTADAKKNYGLGSQITSKYFNFDTEVAQSVNKLFKDKENIKISDFFNLTLDEQVIFRDILKQSYEHYKNIGNKKQSFNNKEKLISDEFGFFIGFISTP